MLGMKRGRSQLALAVLEDIDLYLQGLIGRETASLRFTIEAPLISKSATFDLDSNNQLQDVMEMVEDYGWSIKHMTVLQTATAKQMGVQNTSKETYTLILEQRVGTF